MIETDEDRLNHMIWTRFRNVSSFMRKLREQELNQYGLTIQQAGILHHINALGDDATLTGIARAQYREPAAVSVSLKRLEKTGFIRRNKKKGAGKQPSIILTRKGIDTLQKTARRETIGRALSSLSTSQKHQFLELLDELRGTVVKEMANSHRDAFLDIYNRD
jgi:DNA-binding MarR family transcriptional regulator